jgi:4-amino-4-deoxy-L-arabinose transferase-like glycosyltransferase
VKILPLIGDVLQHALDHPHALRGILFVALCLRLICIPIMHIRESASDEGEYRYIAERVAEGRGFVDSNGTQSVRAPLYPLLLALFLKLPGNAIAVAYIFGALAGTLVVYLGFLLAKIVWADHHAALIAAALLTLHPSLVMYSGLLLPEAVYPVFVLMTLILAASDKNTLLSWAALGLAAGAAALTKAVFLPFFLLLTVALVLRRRGKPRPLAPTISFLVFLLALLPWSVRNYEVQGALIPVSTFSGPSFLLGQNPFTHGTTKLDPGFEDWVRHQLIEKTGKGYDELTESEWSSLSWRIGADYVREHPWRWVALLGQKAYAFLIYPISYSDANLPVEALAVGADCCVWLLLCVAASLACARNKCWWLLLLPLTFFTASHVALHAESRYRLPLTPLLCIFGAGGAVALLREEWRREVGYAAWRRLGWSTAIIVVVYGGTGILFLLGRV